jgi:NAD-dependent deacetylase
MSEETTPTAPEKLVAGLLKARRVVVFSGAGVSAESGIATFRGAADSVWSKMNPSEMATPEAWKNDKELVWAWYEARRGEVMRAQPNAGHLAIAKLAETLQAIHGEVVRVDVITQNVDNLHERGGSGAVLHLHGSLFAPRCFACQRPGDFETAEPDGKSMSLKPPCCQHCGGYIRPGVVWFSEALPQDVWRDAEDLVDLCDAMLVVGTSGVVFPASELPIQAARLGKFTAEVNPSSSNLTSRMDCFWPSTAAAGLPALLEALNASKLQGG